MIHRIYSDLPKFKNLNLRPGLNVLLAQKTEGASQKQTRNRAGKTSVIEIIHFLLGADSPPKSLFQENALREHRFGMVFDLSGEQARVERSGATKAKIHVSQPIGHKPHTLTNDAVEKPQSTEPLGRWREFF